MPEVQPPVPPELPLPSPSTGPLLEIPELSLVVLIGACGAGLTGFAGRNFPASASLSVDPCPSSPDGQGGGALNQPADLPGEGFFPPAITTLHNQVRKRLYDGLLTCASAPLLLAWQRRPLLDLARRAYVQAIAIVFDLPEALLQQRSQALGSEAWPVDEIARQAAAVRQSLPGLEKEGFHRVYTLQTAEAVETARVVLRKMPSDYRELNGPFDIIGDVHGCADELEALLSHLGYQRQPLDAASLPGQDGAADRATAVTYPWVYHPPPGRMAIFVGDLVDRGPRSLHTCDIVRHMQASGTALCVPGNHDDKFLRMLLGRRVKIENGLETSLAELESLPEPQRARCEDALRDFFARLPSHLVLQHGQLVIAHAGIKASMIGREARRVKDFTLYGETTGDTDAYGLPVRLNWAAHYHGPARIIYGHTPIAEPTWQNRTLNIDTGCVFGGKLTALRYPEMTLVSIPARRAYAETRRPFLPNRQNAGPRP